MSKQTVNIGSSVNDRTGDKVRDAFDKINENFDEVPFVTASKELFDQSAVTADTYASASGSTGSNATYALSDYIPVTPGTTYHGRGRTNGMRFVTAYDSSLTPVEAEGSNSEVSTLDVPESGVAFYRVTVFTADLDTFRFTTGAAASWAADYGQELPASVVPTNSRPWRGLVWASYGDSITYQELWQPYVARALNLAHTAYGVGGRQIAGAALSNAMWEQAQIDTIANSPDLITVMGGTNDWAQSKALGAITSSTVTEFNGAYNTMIENLIDTFGSARLVLMTPPYGERRPTLPDGWSENHENTLGLTIFDYAEEVRLQGKRWGLPVIDIAGEEGCNTLNVDSLRKDDGGRLHPNDSSGKRIAGITAGVLARMASIG